MGLPVIHDDNGIRWITLDRPEIRNALQVEDLDHIADGVRSAGPKFERSSSPARGIAPSRRACTSRPSPMRHRRARKSITRVRDCLGTIRLLRGRRWLSSTATASARPSRWLWPVTLGRPSTGAIRPSRSEARHPVCRGCRTAQQFVGLSKAKEIILTGDMYPLADFAHTGIANRIVDPSELHASALDLANQLGSYTPQVMAAQKGLFETWLNYGLQHGIDTSVDVFAEFVRPPGNGADDRANISPPRGADRAKDRSCGSRIRTTTWPVCGSPHLVRAV